jgi:uncharacterized repeat protein (TIGR03803 family)
VQGYDGNLYGTTVAGGANGNGTVFKISSAGALTTLHSFTDTDGNAPSALVLATDGNFYGTTSKAAVPVALVVPISVAQSSRSHPAGR